jgi:hypothetical protein
VTEAKPKVDDPAERLKAAGYSLLPGSEMWFAPSGGIVSTEQALEFLEAEEAEKA